MARKEYLPPKDVTFACNSCMVWLYDLVFDAMDVVRVWVISSGSHTCRVSSTMAGQNLSESDITITRYVAGYLALNSKVWAILAPVMRFLSIALVAILH